MLNLIFCGNMSHHVKMRNHILGERESFMTKQKGFKRNCSFAFLCMKGKIEEKERHQCPCHQSTEFLDGWDPFDKRLFSTSLLPMLPTYPSILPSNQRGIIKLSMAPSNTSDHHRIHGAYLPSISSYAKTRHL
jgi:hypothetical protein